MTIAGRDVAVVIPSIKDEVRTVESIPAVVPREIVRQGSLNEARNEGVRRTDAEVIVIMDDDIAFHPKTLARIVERVETDTLVGHADWDFGWVAGRVMAFERDLWEQVGGFDETLGSHMGDTEFCLRVRRHGGGLSILPPSWFDHEPHDRSVTTWDRAWRLAYLCGRYPTEATHLVTSMLGETGPADRPDPSPDTRGDRI